MLVRNIYESNVKSGDAQWKVLGSQLWRALSSKDPLVSGKLDKHSPSHYSKGQFMTKCMSPSGRP